MGLSMVEHSVLDNQHGKLSVAVQLQDLWNPGAERQRRRFASGQTVSEAGSSDAFSGLWPFLK